MKIKKKEFYSTSEIARLCHVHRNTIILAIRKGDLQASTTPGGHNRINHEEFVRFAKERGLPVLEFPGDDELGSGSDAPLGDTGNLEGSGHSGASDAKDETPRKKRVLAVDDDKMILKLVVKALASDRFDVATASSGYDAGFKTSAFKPDLILLDIMLGDIDGGEVFNMLRENEFTRHVQILVITAIQNDERIHQIFGSEVPLLKKPFRVKELTERVHHMLGVPVPS